MVKSKKKLEIGEEAVHTEIGKKKLPFFFNGFPELMERGKVGENYGENFFGGLIFCLGEEKK